MAQGVAIATAGLAMQLASLTIFVIMYYYVNYRIAHRRYIIDPKLAVIFLSSKFKIFLLGMFFEDIWSQCSTMLT